METILVHATYNFHEHVTNIAHFRQCYSLDFLQFLAREMSLERVLDVAHGRSEAGETVEDIQQSVLLQDIDRLRKIVASEGERRMRIPHPLRVPLPPAPPVAKPRGRKAPAQLKA